MDCAIIGAGGHAKVVTDILKLNGYHIVGYYDDNTNNNNFKILGKIREINKNISNFVCAIGNNKIRKNIIKQHPDLNWISAIHSSAIISKSSNIGKGTVICAGAIIQPDCIIGDHVIINTKTSIDHDCKINNFCHIAPGSTICGNVSVGNNTFIGAGTTIIQDKKIGKNVLIGAHSLVIKNIESNIKICGVPANLYHTTVE